MTDPKPAPRERTTTEVGIEICARCVPMDTDFDLVMASEIIRRDREQVVAARRADLALDVEALGEIEVDICRAAHPIIDMLDLPRQQRDGLALALAKDVRRILEAHAKGVER